MSASIRRFLDLGHDYGPFLTDALIDGGAIFRRSRSWIVVNTVHTGKRLVKRLAGMMLFALSRWRQKMWFRSESNTACSHSASGTAQPEVAAG